MTDDKRLKYCYTFATLLCCHTWGSLVFEAQILNLHGIVIYFTLLMEFTEALKKSILQQNNPKFE